MKHFNAVMMLLIIVICFGLTACGKTISKHDMEQIEAYGFINIKQLGTYGDGGTYLVYDPATNIEYIAITGTYDNFSLCPYYDEYDNIAVYQEE